MAKAFHRGVWMLCLQRWGVEVRRCGCWELKQLRTETSVFDYLPAESQERKSGKGQPIPTPPTHPDSFRECSSRGTPVVIRALIKEFAVTSQICQLSFMYSWSVKLAFALGQAESWERWNRMQVSWWRGLGIWLLFLMLSAWHFDFTKFDLGKMGLWAEDICFCPDWFLGISSRNKHGESKLRYRIWARLSMGLGVFFELALLLSNRSI